MTAADHTPPGPPSALYARPREREETTHISRGWCFTLRVEKQKQNPSAASQSHRRTSMRGLLLLHQRQHRTQPFVLHDRPSVHGLDLVVTVRRSPGSPPAAVSIATRSAI